MVAAPEKKRVFAFVVSAVCATAFVVKINAVARNSNFNVPFTIYLI
jgi:hypothetical protein